jgi:hypothetical protein
VLIPALVFSLSNSIASAARTLHLTTCAYTAWVSVVNALILGLLPVCPLVVTVIRLPKQPGLAYEWFGLWPLAALLYFVVFALIGATCGGIAAVLRICAERARTSGVDRAVFWSVAALLALFVTEAAVRGWIAEAIGRRN